MSLNNANDANVPIRKLPETDRSQEIRDVFASVYDKKPDYYVRVPGRVNLIGEHIDYCGYSVCPMALEQDIFMAISVEDDGLLALHNLDSKFEDFNCDMSNFEISIGEGAPKWYQYFLCGVKGILDILPKDTLLKGMKVVVKGSVPQSAGLSSSSALVSAASLATAYGHKLALPKEKIASLCADCERYIGTQGGGMDQAIAFLANEGCAKLIEFSPLRSTDVKLPSGSVFVIAHSLTNLNKAATADFNCRVVECRLAAQLMAKKRNLDWTKIKRLRELQEALNLELFDMVQLTKEYLHEQPYSKEELLKELQITTHDLNSTSLTPNTQNIDSFKLRQRAMHVFEEALRVQFFTEACTQIRDDDTLATLGRLMTESHDSLRDLYECSHPQLDRLVELSKKKTFGARLTGAGWGGCIVALLKEEDLEQYMELVTEQFYKPLGIMDGLDGLVFSTSPNAGACIFEE